MHVIFPYCVHFWKNKKGKRGLQLFLILQWCMWYLNVFRNTHFVANFSVPLTILVNSQTGKEITTDTWPSLNLIMTKMRLLISRWRRTRFLLFIFEFHASLSDIPMQILCQKHYIEMQVDYTNYITGTSCCINSVKTPPFAFFLPLWDTKLGSVGIIFLNGCR